MKQHVLYTDDDTLQPRVMCAMGKQFQGFSSLQSSRGQINPVWEIVSSLESSRGQTSPVCVTVRTQVLIRKKHF